MDYSLTFEDGVYVFNYTDTYGFVVTDGKSIEELWINIRDAMQLHQESYKDTTGSVEDIHFTMPLTLSFSADSYAAQLQTH